MKMWRKYLVGRMVRTVLKFFSVLVFSLWGWVTFCFPWASCWASPDEQKPRIAIVGSPEWSDLLTAELSSAGASLVERSQIELILKEQNLQANRLTAENSVRLGGLLGADGFLFLSREKDACKARLVQVHLGVVIAMVHAVPDPSGKTDAKWLMQQLSEQIAPLLSKLQIDQSSAVPVTLAGFHPRMDAQKTGGAEAVLSLMLRERLVRSEKVFVLERWRLEELEWEKKLADSQADFWSAGCLVDGEIWTEGSQLKLLMRLKMGGSKKEETFSVTGRRDTLPQVAETIQKEILSRLKGQTGKVRPWNAQEEAQIFLQEARFCEVNGLYARGVELSETAWVLGLTDAEVQRLRIRLCGKAAIVTHRRGAPSSSLHEGMASGYRTYKQKFFAPWMESVWAEVSGDLERRMHCALRAVELYRELLEKMQADDPDLTKGAGIFLLNPSRLLNFCYHTHYGDTHPDEVSHLRELIRSTAEKERSLFQEKKPPLKVYQVRAVYGALWQKNLEAAALFLGDFWTIEMEAFPHHGMPQYLMDSCFMQGEGNLFFQTVPFLPLWQAGERAQYGKHATQVFERLAASPKLSTRLLAWIMKYEWLEESCLEEIAQMLFQEKDALANETSGFFFEEITKLSPLSRELSKHILKSATQKVHKTILEYFSPHPSSYQGRELSAKNERETVRENIAALEGYLEKRRGTKNFHVNEAGMLHFLINQLHQISSYEFLTREKVILGAKKCWSFSEKKEGQEKKEFVGFRVFKGMILVGFQEGDQIGVLRVDTATMQAKELSKKIFLPPPENFQSHWLFACSDKYAVFAKDGIRVLDLRKNVWSELSLPDAPYQKLWVKDQVLLASWGVSQKKTGLLRVDLSTGENEIIVDADRIPAQSPLDVLGRVDIRQVDVVDGDNMCISASISGRDEKSNTAEPKIYIYSSSQRSWKDVSSDIGDTFICDQGRLLFSKYHSGHGIYLWEKQGDGNCYTRLIDSWPHGVFSADNEPLFDVEPVLKETRLSPLAYDGKRLVLLAYDYYPTGGNPALVIGDLRAGEPWIIPLTMESAENKNTRKSSMQYDRSLRCLGDPQQSKHTGFSQEGLSVCSTLDLEGVFLSGNEIEEYIQTQCPEPLMPAILPRSRSGSGKVSVTLSTVPDGSEIRYTLNGSEPNEKSPLYQKPLEVGRPSIVRARTFKKGYPPSKIAAARFDLPLLGKEPSGLVAGLIAKQYEGHWEEMPDWSQLKPSSTTVSANLTPPADKEDSYGMVYEGWLDIPEDQIYVFALAAWRHCRVYLHDRLVLEQGSWRFTEQKWTAVAMTKGKHPIRIEYLDANKDSGIKFLFSVKNGTMQPVTDSMFWHKEE